MQISLAHAAKAFFVLIHGRFGMTLCVIVVREQVMSVWLFVLGGGVSVRKPDGLQTLRPVVWRWRASNLSKNEMIAPSKPACCFPSGFLFG